MNFKYSFDWKGLDQGVEHTWLPQQLLGVLIIMKAHEPFSWSDNNSPIFLDMEKQFPSHQWRSSEDGAGRSIFRRSNTWKKLNLIIGNAASAKVSTKGNLVLSGDLPIEQVIIDACCDHVEGDSRPFGILAHAFLQQPLRTFTLQELIYNVAGNYRPDIDRLEHALRINFETSPIIPDNLKRRFRSILGLLEKVNAIENTANTWKASDIAVLMEISGSAILDEESDYIESFSLSRNRKSTVRPITGHADPIRFKEQCDTIKDPLKRRLLLEKATNEHERVVHLLADELNKLGSKPSEDPLGYDLACDDISKVIFEIKTWRDRNLKSQLRKAISQLPEYRWFNQDRFDTDTQLVIVLSRPLPRNFDHQYIQYIREDRGIEILFLTEDEFVSIEGKSLMQIVSRLD